MKSIKSLAIMTAVAAAMALGASAAEAHSVYATYTGHVAGAYTYDLTFTNTGGQTASIFASGGGLSFDSYPGFLGATIDTVSFGTLADWTKTQTANSVSFIYHGSNTTTTTGTLLLTVTLNSSYTVYDSAKIWQTTGYDYTYQPGNPQDIGGSQTNSGHVEGPTAPTAVPLPAALWAGLSLLGGMGAFGAMRRKVVA